LSGKAVKLYPPAVTF